MEGNRNHNKQNGAYRTSDTALAAYLYAKFGEVPQLDFIVGDNRAFFVFFNKTPDMEQAISDFDMGRAESKLFFNCYQALLRRVKER